MRYLVTGGGGFIGSHLTDYLVSKGEKVTVLDNFSTGKYENLDGQPVRIIEGDIRDAGCVEQAVQGVDTVFHQAALCSVARSMADPVSTHEVNATGTLTLLDACRKAGVKRVVVASSSSVYGDSETLPKYEDMKPSPLSPYAISKLIGEYYCQVYWQAFGLETVALRYFNVFGPRQDPNSEYAAVIPKFLHMLLDGENPVVFGDGSQTRDFTYVDNVVQANLLAASSSQAAGQVMNIACGDRWSLMDLLHRLEGIVQCEASPVFRDRRPGDVLHSQASIKKAQDIMDYTPGAGGFEEGLQRTVAWFQQARLEAARSVA